MQGVILLTLINRPFARRTVDLGLSLEKRGFLHAPTIESQKMGRYQIEVFSHPAIVHLFNLTRILKYKKGTLAERLAELIKLQHKISTILPSLTPSLPISVSAPLPIISSSLTGKELKIIEDQLDSLICAYIGAYWWYWGTKRN
jgi:predicted RNase H-like nuclease